MFKSICIIVLGLCISETLSYGFSIYSHVLNIAYSAKACCPAVYEERECPNIKIEGISFHQVIMIGLECADCLRASGKDLNLTPDTDPIWYPNPASIPTVNYTYQFSATCRRAIGFYLYAVAPDSSSLQPTLLRICTTILEFGPVIIQCLKQEYPLMAYRIFGQFVRCEVTKELLDSVWGSEKAEKSEFTDGYSNQTLNAIDFIRDGFGSEIV